MEEENELAILEEYEPQLWSCANCFCGLCVENCPAYRETRDESVTARGLAQIGLALISGELGISDLSDEVVFGCVGCGWCETICSMNTPLYIKNNGTRKTKVSGTTMAEKLRSMKILEGGKLPREVRQALVSLTKYGNPYGVGETAKDDWVAGLHLSLEDADTILYVGATIPYDDNSKKMAEAIVYCLKAGQLEFSMLGSHERESGAFARMMGEEWLFSEMMEHNTKMFKERGIKQIICVSPHDYDAFIHYYKDIGAIELKHYSQVLNDLMEDGKLIPKKKINKKVTYHDPCYLGRKNDIYEAPRNILNSMPGLEIIEMEKSEDRSYCCGGGGTGLILDFQNENIDKTRADQIKEVDPDVVTVACPSCYQMLDSAIKSRDYDIEVKDIAQLLKEVL